MTAGHEVRLIVKWINDQPALRAFLAEAAQVEPDADLEALKAGLGRGVQFSWPTSTEEGRATLVWQLMQDIAVGSVSNNYYATSIGTGYSGVTNIQDGWREFAQDVLQPLFDYLGELISNQSAVLHTLERYCTRVEWFDREELYARFAANTRNGEEVYNLDLQRFLYLDGDLVTHAKPRSASGEADLVGGLDTDDPLVCDGKVFDADGRGVAYLVKGVHQIVKYAHDHGKNTAYLAIYNISDKLLECASEGPAGLWPPYVELSGVRVYFVVVRALPPANTASKSGKPQPIRLALGDLIETMNY
jgi:hypothetical protein